MFRKNKEKRAFTLIEMGAVIAIMALFVSSIVFGGKRLIVASKFSAARALTASSPVKEISNLAIWLETTSKKSFIASELQAGAPYYISTWRDINPQLVTKTNAIQATQAQQPTYVENFTNGLPALYFSQDELIFNRSFLYNTNYTAFLVEARNSDFSYQISNPDGTNNTGLEFRYELTNAYWMQQNGGTPLMGAVAVPSFSGPIPRIHSLVNGGASGARQYLNGVLVASVSNPPYITPQGTSTNNRIGCSCSGHAGYIMEFIVFTKMLSDSERQDVESYLSKKWGIKI